MSRRTGQAWSMLMMVGSLTGSCGAEAPGPDDLVSASKPIILGTTDDRVDAYKLTDPNLSPFIYSAGSMWLANHITDNGNGWSTIGTTPYTSVLGNPLCAGTKFYNQPIGSGLACSAFFIAPDMVATANHCLGQWGWSWGDWRIVLDFANESGPNSYPTYVANTRIHRPTAVVASNATDDWAVLQVTPPLEDWRRTFPLDPGGPTSPYQAYPVSNSVAMLGYGAGLPLKYTSNATAWTWGTNSFQTDLDVFDGNSGSPIFDTATSMTLGIAVSDYDDDYYLDPTAHCEHTATYADDRSPQNSVQAPYVQPIAQLVAPAGNPIEPTWRTAKYLSEGPAAVVLTSGDEYVFGGDYYTISYKHRDTPTSWSAWTTVPGGYSLSSQPVAVEGYNDVWLFGHYEGKLMYNHRYTNGSWSNWVPVSTPTPLAQPPAAFSFDVPGSNGLITRIIVVAIVGTDGIGRMFNLTYQIQNGTNTLAYLPGSIQGGSQVVPWTAGAFALVGGTPGAIAGFGTTDDGSGIMTIPTVGGGNVLACARATLSGSTGPYSPATIGWSACAQAFPSNLAVQSAQGVALPGGTQYLVARGTDDANLVSTRSGSTAAWSAWTAFGGRGFAKPVITKSLGTWWTYTLSADRRLAIK